MIEFGQESSVAVRESFDDAMDLFNRPGWPIFTTASGKRLAVNPANVESLFDMEAKPDAN